MSPFLPTLDPVTITLTLLAAFLTLTQAGRDTLGAVYLNLTGSSPSQLADPVSYFGLDDDWAVFDSASLLFRLWNRLTRATPETVKRGRAALFNGNSSGSAWRQICNFAVETSSDVWIDEAELEQWRLKADPDADAATAALSNRRRLSPAVSLPSLSDSLFDIVTESAKSSTHSLPQGHPEVDTSPAFKSFLKTVDRRPPPGAGAIGAAWYEARDERRRLAGRSRDDPLTPDEVTEELQEEARVIRAGQNVFYKYLEPMQLTLLHFSLAGGFSSPKIMSVLRQTGYLVPSRDPYAQTGDKTTKQKSPKGPTPSKYVLPVSQVSPSHQRSADRTFLRLLETTQFVVDVMQDVDALLPPSHFADGWVRSQYPQATGSASSETHSMHAIGDEERAFLQRVGGGRGWQSAVRVRLLHAHVRRKIWDSIQKGPGLSSSEKATVAADRCPFDNTASAATTDGAGVYDIASNGQPINQEDMLVTLAGFSVAPLWCLSRIGIDVSPQEREDFVAVWRHVGFYMGCEESLLRAGFKDARTALGLLFSVIGHVYPESVTGQHGLGDASQPGLAEEQEQQQGTVAALALLQAIAGKPSLYLSMETHCAMARHFLGPCLATYLRIPPTTPLKQLTVDLLLLSTRIPVFFTSSFVLYPRALRARWERKRITLAKSDVRRLVGAAQGGTLATFAGSKKGGEAVVRVRCQDRSVVERERMLVAFEMIGFLVSLAAVFGLGVKLYLG
ncbi:unnamed protein product [Tilletia controversa]|uniref:ER-bound oxygenase mpaB/mpaB'/Rubber oxygenase catalytic domain-containing protein n=2 Tax=Tilletia TaxID=13289 RepID=A0A177TDB3_9BASI|nr:hypothetical protein CF336_g8269 [Tilletia laevis]KAE8183668.1 hypothetical protein CF328_g8108 [Tilletia controversa]KAE8241727.1 hypothetical protein A4X03_0g8099 [Tilletia caries]KAE8186443.1 hypothetical protein CF335_g7444 [Tilletia laevis]CAD6887419.1 unnamed protein product [Tilletia caries]